MAQRGADIDIITGMPLGMKEEQDKAKASLEEEARLRARLQYLDLTKSLDGQTFVALVEKYLEERISQLVAADAQAQAYVKILTDLGQKELSAQKALKALTARYFGTSGPAS